MSAAQPETSPAPELRDAAAVFAALGDETRLRLVAALCAGGAMSIAQLTAGSAMTRQAVTKHLEVLSQAGLVRDSKAGRERCGSSSRGSSRPHGSRWRRSEGNGSLRWRS